MQKNKRRRKNSTLFEVWSVGSWKIVGSGKALFLIKRKEDLNERHLQLMASDNEYFRSITYSTQKRDHSGYAGTKWIKLSRRFSMLEFIRIQRFKSLSDASFTLAPLSLFSGLNGMGKSSTHSNILLLRQSFWKNALFSKGLLLKGDYVNLETGQDILFRACRNANTLEFILTWTGTKPNSFKYSYSAQSDLQPIAKDASALSHPESYSLFNKNFQYLSADRISQNLPMKHRINYIKDMNSLR